MSIPNHRQGRLMHRADVASRSSRIGRQAGLAVALVLLLVGAAIDAQETTEPADAAFAAEATAPQAAAPAKIPDRNLVEIVHSGGVLMWPILACSVVTVTVVFERLVMLRRARVVPRAFVRRFMERLGSGGLDRAGALELCRANASPVAHVFGHAVKRWGRPRREIEQAILDGGQREVVHLRKNLRIINGVATGAPLLGLLGTVVGMIQAFNVIAVQKGIGKPELLAGGISVALLTTAAGLTVAIPSLIAYLYLVGRVDRLVIEIDTLTEQVVDAISMGKTEKPAEQPPDAGKRRNRPKRGGEPAAASAG
jgi:biopolymer transport protein ExbB